MKRVTVKLFIEDPVTHRVVPVLHDADAVQVTETGAVLARESEFNTWRRVGSVAESTRASVMRGKARPV
jgi:hypothetical protein